MLSGRQVSIEYAEFTQTAVDAAAGVGAGSMDETVDRSDKRFKDLPRDATVKEQPGRFRSISNWLLASSPLRGEPKHTKMPEVLFLNMQWDKE